MIVWHVTTNKKLQKYLQRGSIRPPVRAWETYEQAARMSIQTGRRIILRLNFPSTAKKLAGHFNQARVLNKEYKVEYF